jgi:hypothetical protein
MYVVFSAKVGIGFNWLEIKYNGGFFCENGNEFLDSLKREISWLFSFPLNKLFAS